MKWHLYFFWMPITAIWRLCMIPFKAENLNGNYPVSNLFLFIAVISILILRKWGNKGNRYFEIVWRRVKQSVDMENQQGEKRIFFENNVINIYVCRKPKSYNWNKFSLSLKLISSEIFYFVWKLSSGARWILSTFFQRTFFVSDNFKQTCKNLCFVNLLYERLNWNSLISWRLLLF